MSARAQAWAAVLGLCVITAAADVVLTWAARHRRVEGLALAALLYVSMAFGWWWVLTKLGLAETGAAAPAVTTILLVPAGVLFFGERLTYPQWLGVVGVLVSLALVVAGAPPR